MQVFPVTMKEETLSKVDKVKDRVRAPSRSDAVRRAVEFDLLKFGKQALVAIVVLFILGAVSSLVWSNSSIFETCKNILPPIATLILGYYFGKTQ